MKFYLISVLLRLQLVLYTEEEVQSALELLQAIPAYTEVLTIDPPDPLKRKPDEPGKEAMPKPVFYVTMDSEEGKDVKPEPTDTSGVKPKIQVKKPKGSLKRATLMVKLLSKPP